MVPAIFYLFPETSGRSLEEIDEIFTLSKSLLDAVPTAKKLPPRQPLDLPPPERVLVADLKALDSPLESSV